MYNQKVIDHFLHPRNVGQLSKPDGVGTIGDPLCGDYLRIDIKVENNCLQDIKFEVLGCPAAIATSSILTELARGKKLEEALELTDMDVLKALGELPDPKMHCSNLGAEALHKAVWDYTTRIKGKKGAGNDMPA